MLTLIQLQYFVDTVALRSFTLAAKKNYVSKTAVSQQLAKLEERLGVQLIERKQPLVLTAAGQVAFDQAQIILQQYQQMLTATNAIKDKARPLLTCGYLDNLGSPVVASVMQHLLKLVPELELTLTDHAFTALAAQLQTGALDLAVGLKSTFAGATKLALKSISTSTYSILVNKQSPLATQTTIAGKQLAGVPLIMQNQAVLGPAYDALLSNCRADGYVPTIGQLVDSPQTAAVMVALNRGVAFVMPEQALAVPDNVAVVPMSETHHQYTLALAKRAGQQSELIEDIWQRYK